jgi:hypothetical protein
MIATAYHAEKIDAAASAVWPYLSWENLELMLPSGFIEKIEYLERRPVVGASRWVTFAGGRRIAERLESLPEHPGDFAYDYRVIDVGDFPLAEYRGSVRLTPTGTSACALRFACTFTPLGITAEEWRALYVDMQKQQIAFIRRQVEK